MRYPRTHERLSCPAMRFHSLPHFVIQSPPSCRNAINHAARFRRGVCDLTMDRISRFSKTKPWSSCVCRSTTIAQAKSSARITWFGAEDTGARCSEQRTIRPASMGRLLSSLFCLVAITPMLTPRPRALAQSLAAERSWFTAGKIKKP